MHFFLTSSNMPFLSTSFVHDFAQAYSTGILCSYIYVEKVKFFHTYGILIIVNLILCDAVGL